MLRFTYPEGRHLALTFSYDDGQIYDRRLVEIFDRYGMKATFHLNSGTLDTIGNDIEPNGKPTEYVKASEAKELYKNHEIATHGVTHPFMDQLAGGELVREIYEDRRRLEEIAGYVIVGMSYPFGNYSDDIIRTACELGIEYSRTVEDRMDFNLPTDFMKWHPTCHHSKLSDDMIESFLNPPGYRRNDLSLLYVWGHSYEFGRGGNWDFIEDRCSKLSGRDDVWYATNREIMDYVKAVRNVRTSSDGRLIQNPSGVTLYFTTEDGSVKSIAPGGCAEV